MARIETEVDVDIEEFLDEASTESLLEELKNRNVKLGNQDVNSLKDVSFMQKYEVHEMLCNVFDLNRTLTKEQVINKISEHL